MHIQNERESSVLDFSSIYSKYVSLTGNDRRKRRKNSSNIFQHSVEFFDEFESFESYSIYENVLLFFWIFYNIFFIFSLFYLSLLTQFHRKLLLYYTEILNSLYFSTKFCLLLKINTRKVVLVFCFHWMQLELRMFDAFSDVRYYTFVIYILSKSSFASSVSDEWKVMQYSVWFYFNPIFHIKVVQLYLA